jgi:hypothetical protein
MKIKYLLLFLLLLFAAFGKVLAFNYKLTAVYIFNIVKNKTFPTTKTSATIGVFFGNSPVETELKFLLTKTGTSLVLKCVKLAEKTNAVTPIIAVSADAKNSVTTKCKEIGINDYISKPFDSERLKEKIIQLAGENI